MAAGRLDIRIEEIVGFKVNDLRIEYGGVGFAFMDDPRKNRIKFEELIERVRTHLQARQIIDKEEART